jgi:hypothetical protein
MVIPERNDDMLLRDDGEDLSGISRGGHGESGDGAAVGDRKQHPSIEEGDEVAVSFAKINVLAAGFGEHRSEFGEGDATEKRNHAADHPDEQEQHGLRQRAGDVFGGKKNGGADDAADQQQHGIEQAESANQRRPRLGSGFDVGRRGGGVHYPIPSSSGDSSGVPQRRQMTAEQSPQVRGSFTSWAQIGQ